MSALRVLVGATGLACVVATMAWVAPAAGQAVPRPAAAATVDAAVLAHAVERGTILSHDDFTVEQRTPAQARGALAADQAVGKEATRNLAAGVPLRPADVVAPRLVRRGEPVAITLRNGGLAIGTTGRALTSGGRGDLVRVVSLATNRTLDAVVEGSGAVRVVAP